MGIYQYLFIVVGKFKGLSNDSDLSIEDLVDLLDSVDHDKVVNSGDAVISDGALSALLDRDLNLDRSSKTKKKQKSGHSDLFKVIAERDANGNLIEAVSSTSLEGCVTADSANVNASSGADGKCDAPGPSTKDQSSGSGAGDCSVYISVFSGLSSDTNLKSGSMASLSSSSSSSSTSPSESMDVDSVSVSTSTTRTSGSASFSPTPEPGTGGCVALVTSRTEVDVCGSSEEGGKESSIDVTVSSTSESVITLQ